MFSFRDTAEKGMEYGRWGDIDLDLDLDLSREVWVGNESNIAAVEIKKSSSQ